MKNRIKYIFFIFVFLASCNDDFFTKQPKGQASFLTLENREGVEALLIGTYACADGTINSNTNMAWASSVSNWVWGSITSDDARKGSSLNDQADINPIEYFYVNASNNYVYNHYRSYYDAVVRANDVIEMVHRINDDNVMTEEERNQAEAQAKFLRAHFYFQLTIVHGPVPYIDENTEDPDKVPNDHVVWPEIEEDLKFAISHLPESWVDKGRVTSWAAKTFLARVYLFQHKYQEAMPLLKDVYENGGFALMDSYEQNYRIKYLNNEESIWEIQYAVNDGGDGSPNANQGDGLIGPLGSAGIGSQGAFYYATENFVSAFRVDDSGLPFLNDVYSLDDILPHDRKGESVLYKDPIDPRIDWTVGRPGVPFLDFGLIHGGESWLNGYIPYGPYSPYKKNMFWKDEKDGYTTKSGWMTNLNANNFRVYRLGHVILWLAECEVEIGSLDEATRLVNLIRNRAKNSNVQTFEDGSPAANYNVEPYERSFPDQEYGRNAVRHELRLEFGMEGMRFFDLVRWGIAAETLNRYFEIEGQIYSPLNGRHFTKGQHELMPIPQLEIDITNVGGEEILKQNPGY